MPWEALEGRSLNAHLRCPPTVEHFHGDDDKDCERNFLFSLNPISFLIDLFQVMTRSLESLRPKNSGTILTPFPPESLEADAQQSAPLFCLKCLWHPLLPFHPQSSYSISKVTSPHPVSPRPSFPRPLQRAALAPSSPDSLRITACSS